MSVCSEALLGPSASNEHGVRVLGVTTDWLQEHQQVQC